MDLAIDTGKTQYIARISHGKDSLKMLDVIASRGLPLDRITTTDVWATDTIRGEHPKMVEFKERADEYIWKKYRIEVEHLCAMRNGEKVTYEKLFYNIPKRRAKNAGGGGYKQQGTVLGFPTLWGPWCQSDLKRAARSPYPGISCTNRELVQKAQNRLYQAKSRYTSRGSAETVSRDSLSASQKKEPGANISRPGFHPAPPRGAVKISWSTWA